MHGLCLAPASSRRNPVLLGHLRRFAAVSFPMILSWGSRRKGRAEGPIFSHRQICYLSARMAFELVFTPPGRLNAVESAAAEPSFLDTSPGAAADGRFKKVFAAFASGQAQGLFALATERFEGPLATSLAYWRGLAARYLMELCHTPQTAGPALDPIPPPTSAELASLLLLRPAHAGRRIRDRGGPRGPVERPGRLGARRGGRGRGRAVGVS